MKSLTLFLIVWVQSASCFAQVLIKKQILIPLDNNKGVPFYKQIEVNDYFIDGFEIDNKGNFYFLRGDNSACLAVFSGNKLIYRTTYKNMPSGTGQLYFSGDTLYTFNRLPQNKIFAIDPKNGVLMKTYENRISEKINSYNFAGDYLIIQSLGDSKINYIQYSLKGKRVAQDINKYNLPFTIQNDTEFLGIWKDKFVFYALNGKDLENQKFFLTNKNGKIIATKFLPNNDRVFGEGYAENPPEDRKVRNGNLYVLGRKGKFVLITEIPLQRFF